MLNIQIQKILGSETQPYESYIYDGFLKTFNLFHCNNKRLQTLAIRQSFSNDLQSSTVILARPHPRQDNDLILGWLSYGLLTSPRHNDSYRIIYFGATKNLYKGQGVMGALLNFMDSDMPAPSEPEVFLKYPTKAGLVMLQNRYNFLESW